MSASRKARRQQARDQERAARPAVSKPTATSAAPLPKEWVALRRRVRLVLLATSISALIVTRIYREPLQQFLQQHGLWARITVVVVLLAPALFTWIIGLGQLRDASRR